MSMSLRAAAALLLIVTGTVEAASRLMLDAEAIAQYQQQVPEAFALPLPLALDAAHDGEWTLTGDTLHWRHQIEVPGALALALEIGTLQLPIGAQLQIGSERWQGPTPATLPASIFTRHQPGALLMLQLDMPRAARAVLKVVQVQAAFRDPVPVAVHSKAGSECTINFACAVDNPAQRWGGSVVAITVLNTASCTGTLMDNTAGDARPYLITARHCYSAGSDDPVRAAASMRMAWNAVGQCGSPLVSAWGLDTAVTVGAIHRAEFGDTWLVELMARPPDSVGPWYAGFDASDQAPIGGVTGLHNGSSLQRQLLWSAAVPRMALASGVGRSTEAEAWSFVPQMGGAESGSSGSALFDAGGHVIGTLSTGATCESASPLVLYARLGPAWQGDGTRAGSLKPWLDPGSRGKSLPGKSYVGLAVPNLAALQNPPETQIAATSATSGGGGSVSGLLLLVLLGFAALRLTLKQPMDMALYVPLNGRIVLAPSNDKGAHHDLATGRSRPRL